MERDEPPVAIAIVGHGSAFCVTPPRSAADCDASGAAWRQATAAVAALAPPTIAAVNGAALGPAFELALACDLRIAAADVTLGSPEIKWGRMPCAGGTQRLPRAVGIDVALMMLLTGEEITAHKAAARGLVHRIAPSGQLMECLEEMLDNFRSAAPIALAYTKEATRQGRELPMAAGLTLEADLAALLQTTRDRAEGVRAFLERRKPRFEGR